MYNDYYNKTLKPYARQLRKHSTLAEIILWNEVLKNRKLGYKFLRQRPVLKYIGDFYCKDLKLFIELDGATHFERNVRNKDTKKQNEILSHGFTVLRFKNVEVIENLEKVRNDIISWIRNYEKQNPGIIEKKVRRKRN
jgi:very-short-patch-repair endonuclease